jgi:hypothetical protein
LTYGEITHNNFEVWNMLNVQTCNYHMRWKMGCMIFF